MNKWNARPRLTRFARSQRHQAGYGKNGVQANKANKNGSGG